MDAFGDSFSNQGADPFASFGTTTKPEPQKQSFDPFNQDDMRGTTSNQVAQPPPTTGGAGGGSFDPFSQPDSSPALSNNNSSSSFDAFSTQPNASPVISPAPSSFDPFSDAPQFEAPPPVPLASNISFDPFAAAPQLNQNNSGSSIDFDNFGLSATTNTSPTVSPPTPTQKKDPLMAPESGGDFDDFFGGNDRTSEVSQASHPRTSSTGSQGAAQTVEDLDIWGNKANPPPKPNKVSNFKSDKDYATGIESAAQCPNTVRAESLEDDADPENIQLELQNASLETYEVSFPYETKLGMLLERFDELDMATGTSRERTLVKMVIEGGASDMRGVQVGSKLVALNDVMVLNKSYVHTLEMVKTLPRPLKVVMEKVGGFTDASQGVCYTRKDMGYGAPSSLSAWQIQYFVIGGAVAKPNVLQFYDSKQDYEEVVVNMFQNKPYQHINLKAYKLELNFKCGPCSTKTYGGKSMTYFWLKNPKSNFKVLKVGFENSSIVTGLRMQICKHASQG